MTTASGFLGSGDLYAEIYNFQTQTWDPSVGPFETGKFAIKPASEIKKMTSKRRDKYRQTIVSIPLPTDTVLSVSLSEATVATLKMQFSAISTPINQASGTVAEGAPEDVTIPAAGAGWGQLAKKNVASAGFLVKSADGLTTYTVDVDYEVVWRMGYIRSLPGGALAAGATPVKVSYTYNAVAGTKLSGARQNQILARFTFDGKNQVDGLPVLVYVHQARLTVDSEFDFLADEFGNVELTGVMETPVGKEEPYEVHFLDA